MKQESMFFFFLLLLILQIDSPTTSAAGCFVSLFLEKTNTTLIVKQKRQRQKSSKGKFCGVLCGILFLSNNERMAFVFPNRNK